MTDKQNANSKRTNLKTSSGTRIKKFLPLIGRTSKSKQKVIIFPKK